LFQSVLFRFCILQKCSFWLGIENVTIKNWQIHQSSVCSQVCRHVENVFPSFVVFFFNILLKISYFALVNLCMLQWITEKLTNWCIYIFFVFNHMHFEWWFPLLPRWVGGGRSIFFEFQICFYTLKYFCIFFTRKNIYSTLIFFKF
jgi:hypothetical protein